LQAAAEQRRAGGGALRVVGLPARQRRRQGAGQGVGALLVEQLRGVAEVFLGARHVALVVGLQGLLDGVLDVIGLGGAGAGQQGGQGEGAENPFHCALRPVVASEGESITPWPRLTNAAFGRALRRAATKVAGRALSAISPGALYCRAFLQMRRSGPALPSMFPTFQRSAPMTVIKQDDVIQSVADALQYISYYHPTDFIKAMHEAYLREESPAARDSLAQILINSRMCATGHRPICQDTGIVTVIAKVGMDVRWDGATLSLDD